MSDGKYLSRRWLVVYGYILILLISTPYLPEVVQRASLKWASRSVNSFVLGAEIFIGALLIVSTGLIFFYRRRKVLLYTIIIGGSIGLLCLFDRIILNSYEFTHLPEYAILSVLILKAIKREEWTVTDKMTMKEEHGVIARGKGNPINNLYFQSLAITGAVGIIDELYQGLLPTRFFAWYDILLNGLGGVLGLTIVWGISREE
ncbi:MAG: hypothetical protein JRJ08_02160 [Deltaproteobacteria bacterium]|nr:hypothetical protein [Deltaproteobacteria bacterium]